MLEEHNLFIRGLESTLQYISMLFRKCMQRKKLTERAKEIGTFSIIITNKSRIYVKSKKL